ncbi:MAG: hypothetical protein M3Q65_16425 [Chloroflexota bacterium]|nr:hypothetical protein [Chloroflexota bacterium]
MTTVDASGEAVGRTAQAGVAAEPTAGTDARWRARIAGLALIASPILWFVGALISRKFAPQLNGFYGDGDPVSKLNALVGQQVPWALQSVLFFAGTLAALAGLVILAGLLRRTRAGGLARTGGIGIVAVAVVSAFVFLLRLTAPLGGVRDTAEVPALLIAAHSGWLNMVTSGLTALTVAVYGAALFWSGRARLTGALVVALSGLVLIALLGRGSLPPVLIYPVAAIIGVRLLFWDATPAR